MYPEEEQKFLLSLSRRAITLFLENKSLLKLNDSWLPSLRLKELKASFVTLTMQEQLRGCMGHLQPVYPLYEDVIRNSISAAFDDPRFFPLHKGELSLFNIGISILSLPQKVTYASLEDLLHKISGLGVIIQKGNASATYLPEVWEDLPSPTEFMESLCQKAGLAKNEWQKKTLEIQVYAVDHFEEAILKIEK